MSPFTKNEVAIRFTNLDKCISFGRELIISGNFGEDNYDDHLVLLQLQSHSVLSLFINNSLCELKEWFGESLGIICDLFPIFKILMLNC